MHLLKILRRDAVMHGDRCRHAANNSGNPTTKNMALAWCVFSTDCRFQDWTRYCYYNLPGNPFVLAASHLSQLSVGIGVTFKLFVGFEFWNICVHVGLNNSTLVQLIVFKNAIDLTNSERWPYRLLCSFLFQLTAGCSAQLGLCVRACMHAVRVDRNL